MIINRSLTHSKGPVGKETPTKNWPDKTIIESLQPNFLYPVIKWADYLLFGKGNSFEENSGENDSSYPRRSEPSGTVITMTQE